MGILDDTAIFAAVIQQGGFSHAAKHLGLSNGMVSRRIASLEEDLGVTLLTRTTRQIQLTPEGEIFWQHAQRIQQEMDAAVSLIQSSVKKPRGTIRISAPPLFGRRYLTPILAKFMENFPDIHVHLILGSQRFDLVKEQLDLVIRGAGFIEGAQLKDSSLQMKSLLQEKIGIYASRAYITRFGEPESVSDLSLHEIIGYADQRQVNENEIWKYHENGRSKSVTLAPAFFSNDIESGLMACASGVGIARLTDLNAKSFLETKQIRPILTSYEWGDYHLYAVYPQQKNLPRRTRLLLDFIVAHTQNLSGKIG